METQTRTWPYGQKMLKSKNKSSSPMIKNLNPN